MGLDLVNFAKESKSNFATNRKLRLWLKKVKPKVLDLQFEEYHDEAFSEIVVRRQAQYF